MIGNSDTPGIFRTPRGSIRGLPGLFLLVAVLLAPDGLRAQMEDSATPGSGFELFASVGALQPLSNLTENAGSFSTVITPNVTFGVEATLWMSDNFGIGLLGSYSPADLDILAGQFQGTVPSDLGSIDYFAGLLNLTYRIRSSGSASTLEPYFTIGGGVRHVRLDQIAAPEAETSTDPAATIAVGIRVLVADGVWVRGELRDVASLYESPATGESIFQNDIAISFGLGIRP